MHVSLILFVEQRELQLVDDHKIHVNSKPVRPSRNREPYVACSFCEQRSRQTLYRGVEGRLAILRIVKPTSFIGGPGIYYDQRHHFTITALVDSSVCFIDLQVFKQILKGNQAFAEEFLKDFSRDVLRVYNRLIYLTQKQMPGRMADALLYLHDEIFQQLKFPMILSRFDLADFLPVAGKCRKSFTWFPEGESAEISDHEMDYGWRAIRKISRIG